MMLKMIGNMTIKHNKIDDIVRCLEKAGYIVIVKDAGYLESTFLIAEGLNIGDKEDKG